MALNDNGQAKLTEEMRSEITEEEPIENMVKPLDSVSSDDVQKEFEETKPEVETEETNHIETTKVQEWKPAPEKLGKANRKRPNSIVSRSLSKLHGELQKHSDARRKTDLAIKILKSN